MLFEVSKYLRVGKRKHLDFESEFVDFWELRLLRSGRSKFGIFGATNAPWKCHKQPLAQADSVILHAILHVRRNPCREWRSHQQKRPCKPGTPAKHRKFQKSNCASLMIFKRRDIWYRNVNTWVMLLSIYIYIINTVWLYDCIFCYMQFAGDTLMPCQKSHERDRLHALFTFWVVVTSPFDSDFLNYFIVSFVLACILSMLLCCEAVLFPRAAEVLEKTVPNSFLLELAPPRLPKRRVIMAPFSTLR